MTVPPVLLVVMGLTITIAATSAILAWRERPEPGATPLAWLLVGQTIWAVLFVFELRAPTLARKIVWSDLQWIGVVIIPIAWLLFALEYTGRDRYVTPRTIGGLSIPPLITIALAVIGDPLHLLYLETTMDTVNGMQVLHRVGGQWYWAITGYTYLLGLLGTIPLLELVRSDAKPFRGQSALILVGIIAPWASNAVFLSGIVPELGFDPTPIAFTVSGVAYLGAIRWYRLFGTSPAPTRGAHRFVFEKMHEGALVVDRHDYIVDLNDNVADIIEVEPRDALGRPASEVVPDYESLPDDGQTDGHFTIDRNGSTGFYDVNVTRVTDYHDRTVGKVITFHDIGQHLRQQQRLEVMNRVLRHNIRSEAQVILGQLENLPADDESVDLAKQRLRNIENLSKQARTIDDLFEMEETGTKGVSLHRMLESEIESVRERYPSIQIDYRGVPSDLEISSIFIPVFSNLIENAAQHNTSPEPRVQVRCEPDGDFVAVAVEDNGPGINAYEREVLERGRETPLKHGSGLGMWVITWGTRIGGGEVTIEESASMGTVVTITAPVLSGTTDDTRQEVSP